MDVGGLGEHYVLAVYPDARGLAFVLFESPTSLVDWGVMRTTTRQPKNEQCIEYVRRLVDRYVPDLIVIEDVDQKGSRRSQRIRALYRSLQVLACVTNTDIKKYASRDIYATFGALGARTKNERSRAIAPLIHDLSHRLPPPRKAWMSSDCRMSLFEAAGLGLTYYKSA